MSNRFDRERMESITGKTVSEKAHWRVRKAVPEYFEWPRRLRQIYILLATHGSSDAAINSIIEEFGWDRETTWEMITDECNFLQRVVDYREKKEYPRAIRFRDGKPWKHPLTAEHLSIVFTQEAQFEAFAKLMNESKGAGVANHMRAMVEKAGFFGVTDSVSEQAAIALDAGEKPPGS